MGKREREGWNQLQRVKRKEQKTLEQQNSKNSFDHLKEPIETLILKNNIFLRIRRT